MGTLSNKYFNAEAVETALDKGVEVYDSTIKIKEDLSELSENVKKFIDSEYTEEVPYETTNGRYINNIGVQGNVAWSNLCRFTTENGAKYYIYTQKAISSIPDVYFGEAFNVNKDDIGVYIVGNGTICYINTNTDYSPIVLKNSEHSVDLDYRNQVDSNTEEINILKDAIIPKPISIDMSTVPYQPIRFITKNGIQGNANWGGMYSFTTIKDIDYTIYTKTGNSELPLVYFNDTSYGEDTGEGAIKIKGDGSVAYINSYNLDNIASITYSDVPFTEDSPILLQGFMCGLFENLIVFGDSITWGALYTSSSTNVPNKFRYAKLLQKIMMIDNLHVWAEGGKPCSYIWNTYNDNITLDNSLYVINLGTNNLFTDTIDTDCVGDDWTTYANTETGSLGKFIGKIKSLSNNKIVLVSNVTSAGNNVEQNNKVIKALADRFDCIFVDLGDSEIMKPKYHTAYNGFGNYVHFNNLGNSYIATQIYNQFLRKQWKSDVSLIETFNRMTPPYIG